MTLEGRTNVLNYIHKECVYDLVIILIFFTRLFILIIAVQSFTESTDIRVISLLPGPSKSHSSPATLLVPSLSSKSRTALRRSAEFAGTTFN